MRNIQEGREGHRQKEAWTFLKAAGGRGGMRSHMKVSWKFTWKEKKNTFALDLFLTLQKIMMSSSLTLTFSVIFQSQKLDPVFFVFLPLLIWFHLGLWGKEKWDLFFHISL